MLAAAGPTALALADGIPLVTVQQRLVVLPKLPADSETPPNLPQDGEVKLPFVAGGATGVARRINDAVWKEFLDGTVAPTTPGKTYTPPRDKLPQGTSSLEFKTQFIPSMNPRLLSLELSGEGCGAYCESFTTTRVFDLHDGHQLSMGDLLTPDGFSAVGRRVDAERRRAYKDEVREIRAAIKAAPKGKKTDDDDDNATRLALNEGCLKEVDERPSTPWWLAAYGLSLDGHGGMAVSVGRCSNHVNQGLDDVGDVTVAIPAADLRPALTPYGLAVVCQEGDAPKPGALDHRELHGRLGGIPITMKLELREGVLAKGWYAYDKFHTPIALSVRQAGGGVEADEQTESKGHFDLTPAGGSLVGTWADKHKKLPVIVQ